MGLLILKAATTFLAICLRPPSPRLLPLPPKSP